MAVSPDFLKFQTDLKRTAFGVKFARALFTAGNGSLSAKFIRSGFKQLGLEIPDGIEITLDVAQMITTGAAISDAVEAYENFDDIKSIARLSVNELQLAMNVAGRLGWIDKNSDGAQIIRTGSNVAMIIGSAGLDVRAWMSLALDFTSFEARNEFQAKQIAVQGLMQSYRARINPQATAAASVLKEYQESKISVFQYIGKIAEVAPDLWPQYFPQFESWAPVRTFTMYSRGESTTWYGSENSYTASHVWRSIEGYTPDQIRQFIYDYIVDPVLKPFWLMRNVYVGDRKADLKTLAILSTLSGFTHVDSNRSYLSVLLENQVTLSDFRDPLVLEYLDSRPDPRRIKKSAAIIESGREAFSSQELKNQAQENFVFDNRELIKELERAGRIDAICSIPEMKSLLSKAMLFQAVGIDRSEELWKDGAITLEMREKFSQGPLLNAGAGAPWRMIRNYFAALAMINEIRDDKYFDSFGKDSIERGMYARGIESYDFIADAKDFEETHKRIAMKSALRKVNTLALGNVAYFLGTTPDKLIRVNRNDKTASAVYDKKG